MSDLFPSDLSALFLTIIISGGIVAGLFEWLRNELARRRDEYMDISKTKIEYVSKALPYYGQQSHYYYILSTLFQKPKRALDISIVCLYFTCNILRIRQEYFQKFGMIQLDNTEAESILEYVAYEFDSIVLSKMGFKNYSMMCYLTKNNLPYYDFESLSDTKEIVKDFEANILRNRKSLKDLEEKCRCFYKLMYVELNHLYRIWYGEDIGFEEVSDDKEVIDFLREKFPTYLIRISSFNRWPLFRRLMHPLQWNKVRKAEKSRKISYQSTRVSSK